MCLVIELKLNLFLMSLLRIIVYCDLYISQIFLT